MKTLKEYLTENFTSRGEFLLLTRLDIRNKNITSIRGIDDLKNLQYIFCDNNFITTLEGIEKLPNLKRITFSNNFLPDEDSNLDLYELKLKYKIETRKRKIVNILK